MTADLEERFARATSILLVLQNALPDGVLDQLAHASRRGTEIDVLFNGFRDGAYLKRLHDAGMRLYETAIIEVEPSAVFVDRHEGYTLPTWAPIEAAFSRVYQLLWRRLGVVIEVEGRVTRMTPEDSLVELESSRPVFLKIRDSAIKQSLRDGRRIRALGIAAFVGIRGMSVLLDAVHVEPCGENAGSLA
ncbi:MAG TPA: hypothetical protein VGT40_15725 [Methylomirabilota bacterium]|nr:hypothetical protein [Methylomirabilota bacterium]